MNKVEPFRYISFSYKIVAQKVTGITRLQPDGAVQTQCSSNTIEVM